MKKFYTNFSNFDKVQESKDETLNEKFGDDLTPKAKALGNILASADFEEFYEEWLDYLSGDFDETDKRYKNIKLELETMAKRIK